MISFSTYDLKSSMDRFIAFSILLRFVALIDLKSSMDRFIEMRTTKKSKKFVI